MNDLKSEKIITGASRGIGNSIIKSLTRMVQNIVQQEQIMKN